MHGRMLARRGTGFGAVPGLTAHLLRHARSHACSSRHWVRRSSRADRAPAPTCTVACLLVAALRSTQFPGSPRTCSDRPCLMLARTGVGFAAVPGLTAHLLRHARSHACSSRHWVRRSSRADRAPAPTCTVACLLVAALGSAQFPG